MNNLCQIGTLAITRNRGKSPLLQKIMPHFGEGRTDKYQNPKTFSISQNPKTWNCLILRLAPSQSEKTEIVFSRFSGFQNSKPLRILENLRKNVIKISFGMEKEEKKDTWKLISSIPWRIEIEAESFSSVWISITSQGKWKSSSSSSFLRQE